MEDVLLESEGGSDQVEGEVGEDLDVLFLGEAHLEEADVVGGEGWADQVDEFLVVFGHPGGGHDGFEVAVFFELFDDCSAEDDVGGQH